MLANKAKLEYKAGSASSYTELKGLKEIPDMGKDPEKVEVTTLEDTAKQYEFGIGDYGDMEFKFKYDNSAASSSYRILRELDEDKTKADFKLTFADGTSFAWQAYVSVKLNGGGVNAAIEFTASMALQSEIDVTDPA